MPKRVAIVTEAMTGFGGGDRFLISLAKYFKEADIYTSTLNLFEYEGKIDKNIISRIKPILSNVNVSRKRKGIFQSFSRKAYHLFGNIIYENLDLRGYDLIISISSRFAKFIITPIESMHINICLTPAGYEWDDCRRKLNKKRFYNLLYGSYYRILDVNATKRADLNLSISKFIQKKARKFYGIDSEIIYPCIDNFWFQDDHQDNNIAEKNYFLVVSSLYNYKRIDLAIKACIANNQKLIIIGIGPELNNLKKLSNNNENIIFKGFLPDVEVKKFYRNATALLFCGTEDFGLTPVESQACGTPVIAFKEGGALETIIEGITGEFFANYSNLKRILISFNKKKYKFEAMRKNAEKFSEENFNKNLEKLIK